MQEDYLAHYRIDRHCVRNTGAGLKKNTKKQKKTNRLNLLWRKQEINHMMTSWYHTFITCIDVPVLTRECCAVDSIYQYHKLSLTQCFPRELELKQNSPHLVVRQSNLRSHCILAQR